MTILPQLIIFASCAGDIFPAFETRPTFATAGHEQRDRLIAELKHWRQAYRFAYEQWVRGNRSVGFPLGTNLMVRRYRAPLAPG